MESQNFPAPITYVSQIQVNSTEKNASGFYDQLNQMQYDNLQKFKEALKTQNVIQNFDVYDDLYLLRFLRARKFDLEKTMLMFKNFLEWREKEKVDDIRENFDFTEMFEVKKFYPHSYHKTDKSGRPIYIEMISKVNLDELFKVTTEERMTKYYIREYERLMKRRFPACSSVVKKPIEQSLTILDIQGIGVSHLVGKTKAFVQLASKIGQDYYPEMLGTMMRGRSALCIYIHITPRNPVICIFGEQCWNLAIGTQPGNVRCFGECHQPPATCRIAEFLIRCTAFLGSLIRHGVRNAK